MICFYLYLFTAVLFLLVVQCKGMLGFTSQEIKKHRYKYDALEYYQSDIEWCTFNFVMIVNNLNFLFLYWNK